MKYGKIFYIIIIIASFAITAKARAQFVFTGYYNYYSASGNVEGHDGAGSGFAFMMESAKYCNLRYGFRIDKISFERPEDEKKKYFDDFLILSPEVRYIFTKGPCYGGKFAPYIQGMLNLSSIGGSDNLSRGGMGASLGAGIFYPFSFLKRCWSVDFGIQYSAPNFIFKADGRPSLESININIGISVGGGGER